MLTLVLVVILTALVFEFINGFHDTANSIATVVATKVLSPGAAVSLAAVMNLVGALMGTAVAATIATGIVNTEVVEASSQVILCALLARSTDPMLAMLRERGHGDAQILDWAVATCLGGLVSAPAAPERCSWPAPGC